MINDVFCEKDDLCENYTVMLIMTNFHHAAMEIHDM